MVPTSEVALAILLLAIAPGYITVATWARARTWKGPANDLRTILQSLVLSAVVQALLSPLVVLWIVPVRTSLATHGWRVAVWIIVSVIVLPVVLGIASARLTDWIFNPSEIRVKGKWARRLNRVLRPPTMPTAWDWLFTADRVPESAFLLVGFKDGSRVAGAYAKRSLALTSPETHGIFLEREWMLDENGDIVGELPGSAGLLIPTADDVRFVRILVADDGDKGGQADESTA